MGNMRPDSAVWGVETIHSLANLPTAFLNVSSLFAKQNRTTFWSNPPP